MRIKNALLVLLFAGLSLSGCIEEPAGDGGLVEWEYTPASDPAPPATAPETPDDGGPLTNKTLAETFSTRFVALGDMGTGKEDQFRIAEAVASVCALRGCDFALALGDNIYESGVQDAYDPQFETKFEQPYADLSMPFYLTLGNHDNSYDPTTGVHGQDAGIGHWWGAGQHQVDYTYRDDRTSEKWTLPARYYSFSAGPVTFFSLDSNTLMYRNLVADADTVADAQEAWIDDALAASDTPWNLAFAHHPYLSNGEHGDAGNYESHNYEALTGDQQVPHPASGFYVKEFMEAHVCDKVQLYLTGHDHDLQWLEPTDACGRTEFIVSGAAAKTRDLANEDRNPTYFQQGGTLGFVWIEATEASLTATFFDVDQTELFTREVLA